MAEWSIAVVLKTIDCNRSGSSNLSSSALSLANRGEVSTRKWSLKPCWWKPRTLPPLNLTALQGCQ